MTSGEAVTGLSYLVGAGVFLWAARRRRLATEGMGILAGVGFVAGIVGAKLTQTIASGFSLSKVANPGGRALLGGLLFGWIGVEIAKRMMGIRRSTGDLFALALPAGEAVGRIGCHLNGCCYGVACDAPYAVWNHDAWRFPSQLLSAFVAAATFGVMLWLSGEGAPSEERGGGTVGEGVLTHTSRSCKQEEIEITPSQTVPPRAHVNALSNPSVSSRGDKGNPLVLREGDLFRIYLVLFGVTRFGLEFVRWRESTVLGLSPMQWFCLDLIVIGAVGLLRKKKHEVPQLRPRI